MSTVACLLLASAFVSASAGCAPPCDSVTYAGVSPSYQDLYGRPFGLSWTVYATNGPSAGGLLVGNGCPFPTGAAFQQFKETECVSHAGDEPCPACLREWCCAGTPAWANHVLDAGAELGVCVEAHCDAACTPPDWGKR